YSGNVLQERKHVLMEDRVSELIEYTVVNIGVSAKPVDRTDGENATYVRISNVRLRYHIDIIVPAQLRQQLGAVLGDPASLRRQWRNVREPRPDIGRYDRVPDVIILPFLDCGQRPSRGRIPGKTPGLFQAVALEFGAVGAVGHDPSQFGSDIFLIVWIEQRIGPADNLRQAGGIGRNDGGAARHRLERRQAETFVP